MEKVSTLEEAMLGIIRSQNLRGPIFLNNWIYKEASMAIFDETMDKG